MGNDRKYAVAVNPDPLSSSAWDNRQVTWPQMVKRLKKVVRTKETCAEYAAMGSEERGKAKNVGGFVCGELRDGLRRKGCVLRRSMVTLDIDRGYPGIDFDLQLLKIACYVYPTHSSSEAQPRYRVIIPLSRDVSEGDYEPLARWLAYQILGGNMEPFDKTTYQPERLMYWPSLPKDGEDDSFALDGSLADPDEVFDEFDKDDRAEWPHAKDEAIEAPRMEPGETLPDPATKEGAVGLFCTAYDIPSAIAAFLGEYIEPGSADNRFTWKGGHGRDGIVAYPNGYAYTHDETAPSSGKSLNAFDLVRVFLFGERDRDSKPGTPITSLPSYKAMRALAYADPTVKEVMAERAKAESEAKGVEPADWMKGLEVDEMASRALHKDVYADTPQNYQTILTNDSGLKGVLGFNTFRSRIELRGKAPWSREDGALSWTDRDESHLRIYVSERYGLRNRQNLIDAINAAADSNPFSPVQEFISSAAWDGTKRADALFIDYLGADDSTYVREVTHKALLAAVCRAFRPGCKWDYMVVLIGKQGIGKSMVIAALAGRWFSSSIQDFTGKESCDALDNVWIAEIGELAAMRRSDRESVKAFISRTEDVYRRAYERNTSYLPRKVVFFGTTNEADFLNDSTGARRFLPIQLDERHIRKKVFEDFGDHADPEKKQALIHQIWAEAKTWYDAGENPMEFSPETMGAALEQQEAHQEDDPLRGMVGEYLGRPVTEDWYSLSRDDRVALMQNLKDGSSSDAKGHERKLTVPRDKVCVQEVWCELMGRPLADIAPMDSKRISAILRRMPGWEAGSTSSFGPGYDTQKVFKRSKKA